MQTSLGFPVLRVLPTAGGGRVEFPVDGRLTLGRHQLPREAAQVQPLHVLPEPLHRLLVPAEHVHLRIIVV